MTLTYIDSNGYIRYKDNDRLVHREIAFKYIYSTNRKQYPLRFSEYQVHHKDGDKQNNIQSNLTLVTKREHENIQGYKFDKETCLLDVIKIIKDIPFPILIGGVGAIFIAFDILLNVLTQKMSGISGIGIILIVFGYASYINKNEKSKQVQKKTKTNKSTKLEKSTIINIKVKH